MDEAGIDAKLAELDAKLAEVEAARRELNGTIAEAREVMRALKAYVPGLLDTELPRVRDELKAFATTGIEGLSEEFQRLIHELGDRVNRKVAGVHRHLDRVQDAIDMPERGKGPAELVGLFEAHKRVQEVISANVPTVTLRPASPKRDRKR